MDNRERFLRTMRYESVDHPPLVVGGPWREARERWEAEGLPKGADLYDYFGLEPMRLVNVGRATRIFPDFETRELERTDDYVVKINARGVKVKVTRAMEHSGPEHYLDYPIKGPADKLMRGLGLEVSAYAVADLYHDFLDNFVIDRVDRMEKERIERLGLHVVATDTIMKNLEDKIRLARITLKSIGVRL